jgi:hypothetical protein
MSTKPDAEPAVHAAVCAGDAPALWRNRAQLGDVPLGRRRARRGALLRDVGQPCVWGHSAGSRAALLRPHAGRRGVASCARTSALSAGWTCRCTRSTSGGAQRRS